MMGPIGLPPFLGDCVEELQEFDRNQCEIKHDLLEFQPMHTRLLSFAFLLIFAAPSVFADPYIDLEMSVTGMEGVLTIDGEAHVIDQADMKLEASDEFFPGENTATGSTRRSSSASTSPYVTFQIEGTWYVFTDVPVTAWFAPFVRDVADRGIVSGYRDAAGIPTGIFGPAKSVSIEELAKMALEAAQIDRGACTGAPMNVIAQKSWSANYIRCAEQRNFAVYADGTVDITRPATRAEVVMTVLQAFGVALRDTPPPGVVMKDVNASTLFSSAVFTALADGIVSGDSDAAGNPAGTFRPGSPVNRAEVSKIISLAVQVYGQR